MLETRNQAVLLPRNFFRLHYCKDVLQGHTIMLGLASRIALAADRLCGVGADVLDLKDEHLLLLYALKRQALEGPCKDSKPWGWNAEESTRWHAWSSLDAMSGVEAMRLYVRTLEEELVRCYLHCRPFRRVGAEETARAPQTLHVAQSSMILRHSPSPDEGSPCTRARPCKQQSDCTVAAD